MGAGKLAPFFKKGTNMKKLVFILGILIIALVGLIYAETAIYQGGTTGYSTNTSSVMYAYIYELDNDVNDFSSSFNIGNAILDRIVIDANGTDTSFKLYLYDTSTTYNDATLWSKTDLTTASVPYSYALTMADTDANDYRGIPVNGNLTVTLADGDDATMTGLEVYLFYRRQ
jgi:hypothetical protein